MNKINIIKNIVDEEFDKFFKNEGESIPREISNSVAVVGKMIHQRIRLLEHEIETDTFGQPPQDRLDNFVQLSRVRRDMYDLQQRLGKIEAKFSA